MRNGKTTATGILTLITAAIGVALKVLQGQGVTAEDIAILSSALTSGLGLIFAKDGNK